jgi:signal transduction histidine kinase
MVLLLGVALAWLCWRLVEQDRQLEAQRAQERLEQASDRAAAAWSAGLAELDAWLPASGGPVTVPPPGVVALTKTDRGIQAWPPERLLYGPGSPPVSRSFEEVFASGERLEFETRDPAGAVATYQLLAKAKQEEVRAGALLRLGRVLRKSGRYREALAAYGELARVKDVEIEGMPAELVALDARCGVFDAMARPSETRHEALRMDAGLRGRRWPMSGAAFEFLRAEAQRWVQPPPLTPQERDALALSGAAEWVDQLWPRPIEPSGRRLASTAQGPVLVSWRTDSAGLAAVLAGPERVASMWAKAQTDGALRTALVDASGKPVLGVVAAGQRAVRSPAAPGMAAALVVTLRDPADGLATAALRRRFLLAGFAVLALLLAGGSYFMARYTVRENVVARMQTDFVATVSHEFRTPLTSIRQLSEMLANGRIATEPERAQAYGVLTEASERLQRLVESLLDFGRMEAATFRYRFDELDSRELVGGVVEAFRRQASQDHAVELKQPPELPAIRGDRDALGVALWNLLDNAVKYSPGRPTVWVETKTEGRNLAVTVRDEGPGVQRAERRQIFEKFARGAAARDTNVKGTGIGLSMARHIARAHGGEIRVESQAGLGSTFTLVVPGERKA